MRSERQVRRTRPKLIASCRARECEPEVVGRGFLPRVKVIERGNDGPRSWPRFVTVRDNFHSRSPSAKCCEFYANLHDRFRLEVIEIGGLSDFNYCCHAVVGGTGKGVQVKGGARVRGAAPVGSRGDAPAGGSGAEPPDCHETNLKCVINKFFHEMRHDL